MTQTVVLGATTLSTGFVLNTTGSVAAGTVTAITITSPNATTTGTSLTIDNTLANNFVNYDAVNNSTHAFTTSSANSSSAIRNVSQPTGFSYSQLGSWIQCSANCQLTGVRTAVIGFFANGDATAPANIPTTGTATYTGIASGLYVDATGAGNGATHSTITAITDFAARTVNFATTGTTANSAITSTFVANPSLDISGSLSYGSISAGGRPIITGTVSSTGMTGNASAQFNGPVAQEMAGVYHLSGTNGSQVGAFAAKK